MFAVKQCHHGNRKTLGYCNGQKTLLHCFTVHFLLSDLGVPDRADPILVCDPEAWWAG